MINNKFEYKYKFTALSKVDPNSIVKKVWLFSFLIILFLFSILFLPWEQTVKGKGKVIALDPTERDYTVLAPVDGFIEKFYVQENQFVKAGDPILKMVDLDNEYLSQLNEIKSNLEFQISNTKLEINNLEQQVIEMKEYLQSGINIFDEKIRQIKDKIKSLEYKKLASQKNYEIEKNNFARIKSLFEDGIESKRKYELAESSYLQAKAEFQKITIDINVEKRNIGIQNREKNKFLSLNQNKLHDFHNKIINVQSKEKKLNQQLANHKITIKRYQNSEIIASKDGYVVRLFKNDQNRYIKKGEKIFHFAPKVTKKFILLKVTDFNMPLIKKDLPTRIIFYGWPALQISGWPEIKFGSFAGVIDKVEYISHEAGYYYAYVVENPEEPWPKGEVLRLGTQATVWVRLSTVPIWYQLWRFMNALPPKMVHPDENNEKVTQQ
jgi:multidrug efflux pump subunit AcrA (membrane-fusion protein)